MTGQHEMISETQEGFGWIGGGRRGDRRKLEQQAPPVPHQPCLRASCAWVTSEQHGQFYYSIHVRNQ